MGYFTCSLGSWYFMKKIKELFSKFKEYVDFKEMSFVTKYIIFAIVLYFLCGIVGRFFV